MSFGRPGARLTHEQSKCRKTCAMPAQKQDVHSSDSEEADISTTRAHPAARTAVGNPFRWRIVWVWLQAVRSHQGEVRVSGK